MIRPRSGYTIEMTKWKRKTGLGDIDYIKHLEAALRKACMYIADSPHSFEKAKCEDDWFNYFMYKVDLSNYYED